MPGVNKCNSDQPADPKKASTLRRRIWRSVIAFVLLGFVAVNGVAFMQAWAMTHYVPSGTSTEAPEHLSLLGKLRVLTTGVHVIRPMNLQTPADYGLQFSIGHAESDQFDLETWLVPAPSTPKGLILMYHGYPASKASLLPAAQGFHKLGYSVELVDFRGSGGSSGSTTTIGFREADDVVATVNQAKAMLAFPNEPIVLYGQSMGAAAILRAVGELKLTGVNAIIIESTYDRLLSTAGNRFHAMHLPAFPLAHLLIFWGGAQQGYWGFKMNPVDFAAQIHCPVLMFHGALDARVTTAQAEDVFNHLAGQKQLDIFQQAGHLAFLNSDPERWQTAVDGFLSRSLINGR